MPTYEYACPKCKKSYETREGFDAPTTQKCEKCGKGIAKRVLHAPRVVFKGDGFYATDSRSGASAALGDDKGADDSGGAESGDKAPAKAGSKSDATADSKPAGKSDSKSDSKSESKSGSKSDSKPKGKAESTASS